MNNSNKILTISIAAYNAQKYIEKCLESILSCKNREHLDVIIVNDGSTDDTSAICQKYLTNYNSFLRLINKENGGHGSTINTSIVNARGVYFKILDSDDWIEPNGLDMLVEYLKNADVDMVVNPYYEVTANTGEKRLKEISKNREYAQNNTMMFTDVCSNIKIAMHSITFNTSLLKKIGPIIDEHCFYVDAEYTLFPLPDVKTIKFFDYPIYNYLLGTATQSMNIGNMVRRRGQHLKVTKRMIVFYTELEYSCINKFVIRQRVLEIICSQYYLYLLAKSEDTKSEFYEFDLFLKNTSHDLYQGLYDININMGSPYLIPVKYFYLKIIKLVRSSPSVYGITKKIINQLV